MSRQTGGTDTALLGPRPLPKAAISALKLCDPHPEAANPCPGAGAAGDLNTGMLVVESVVPGGPAAGSLQPGDVLVRVDGRVVTHFLPLEEALDDAVGGHVTLGVERGGQELTWRLAVADLHAVTPAALLQVSGAVLHSLSYQQVRNTYGEARPSVQCCVGGRYRVERCGNLVHKGSTPSA